MTRSETLGIVGGGQLGRMLAMAAARLDIGVVILDPKPNAPASQVANHQIVAGYDNIDALRQLAAGSDVVTYEFENVPAAGLEALEAGGKLRPGRQALAVSQDRLTEKEFFSSVGLTPAPYRQADSHDEIVAAATELTADRSAGDDQVIVKTRRLGYDGKGQARASASDLVAGRAVDQGGAEEHDLHQALGGVPLVVEQMIPFAYEISVIGARAADGSVALYDPARNTHQDGVLGSSVVPSGADRAVAQAAKRATRILLDGLGYVGVIGVEFFVLDDGSLLVNEFAPRVHNSGHWTEAACLCSQFEQHVRAVTGRPLGDPGRHSNAEMRNLLGDPSALTAELTSQGDWMLHLYGKAEARPGRKMGHATRLTGPAES